MKTGLILILLIFLVGCQKKIDKNYLPDSNQQTSTGTQVRNQKKSSFSIKLNGRDVTDSVVSTIKDDNNSRVYQKGLMLKAIYSGSGNSYTVSVDDKLVLYALPTPIITSYTVQRFLIHNFVNSIDVTSTSFPSNISLIPGDSYHLYIKVKYYGNAGSSGVLEARTNTIVPIKEPYPFYLNTRPLYRYGSHTLIDNYYTTNWSQLRSGTSTFNWHGWEGNIFITQVPNTVPLYKYYYAGRTNHYYTINFATLGNGALGYTYEGIAGYVYASPVSGTVPLYQFFNHGSVTHCLTTDYAELGSGSQGYVFDRIECYVLPSFPNDLRPLHAYHYQPVGAYTPASRTDNFYTIDFRRLGSNSSGYTNVILGKYVDFIYEGVTGTVMNTQRTGSVPLYKYFNGQNDHLYSIDYSPSGLNGYSYEQIECYVWGTQQPGAIPLYRYYSPTKKEHYYTVDFSELGNGNSIYNLERIECYIYP
jgi:hypothetical protein